MVHEPTHEPGKRGVTRRHECEEQAELADCPHRATSDRGAPAVASTAAGAFVRYLLAHRVSTLSPCSTPSPSSRPSTTTSISSSKLSGSGPSHETKSPDVLPRNTNAAPARS